MHSNDKPKPGGKGKLGKKKGKGGKNLDKEKRPEDGVGQIPPTILAVDRGEEFSFD